MASTLDQKSKIGFNFENSQLNFELNSCAQKLICKKTARFVN